MSNIRTSFIYPPIPMREFDWCATYDGDEPDDNGNLDIGYGETQQKAIDDLLTNFPREEA